LFTPDTKMNEVGNSPSTTKIYLKAFLLDSVKFPKKQAALLKINNWLQPKGTNLDCALK